MSKRTTADFVELASAVHGNKYDYSKVEYKGSGVRVCIICPIHGEFWQIPNDHLRGAGCKRCYFDANKRMICGIAVNDASYPVKIGNVVEKPYKQWAGMIHRCYDKKEHNYLECSVCTEWLTYSNFKKWFDEHYQVGYDLDKDILIKGNKVYSPETCCFVPQEINKALTKTNAKRGEHPIGVTESCNKYKKFRAQIELENKKVSLGYFHNVEDAFFAYKTAKEEYLKTLANKWKEHLDPRVYKALCNYQVDITD